MTGENFSVFCANVVYLLRRKGNQPKVKIRGRFSVIVFFKGPSVCVFMFIDYPRPRSRGLRSWGATPLSPLSLRLYWGHSRLPPWTRENEHHTSSGPAPQLDGEGRKFGWPTHVARVSSSLYERLETPLRDCVLG